MGGFQIYGDSAYTGIPDKRIKAKVRAGFL